MNMDLNYLPQFKSVIEDIVKTEIKNAGITNYISAVVQAVNNDGTVDVYLPPNRSNLVTKLFNKTGEELNIGDSVEIATKSGSLSNAWIALKHGNTSSDAIRQERNCDNAEHLRNLGRHTEAASSSTASSPYEGLLRKNTAYITSTYNDPNTPANFGNILSVSGGGSSQLMMGWNGNDTDVGHLYYRSHRDMATSGWRPWVTILDSNNYSNYALSTSGGTVNGNISAKKITSNGKLLMSSYTISLGSYSTNNFYPVTFNASNEVLDCEIFGPSRNGDLPYNRNVIHFQQVAAGWSDTPNTLNVLTYKNYDNSEISIGCIGYGTRSAYDRVVWLRGGLDYTIIANFEPVLHTSNYTSGSGDYASTFTVGTTYHGGTNTNVGIHFTPQTDIQGGSYFTDSIKTAGSLTANGITSHGQINADSAITSNGTITGNTLGTSNGYCYVTCSGVTLQIGAANSSFIHFINQTNSIPFYFNKPVHIAGDVYGGSDYNSRLAYASELPAYSTGSFTMTKSSGNGNITSARYYRWGRVVYLEIVFNTSGGTTSAGSNIWSGKISGIELPAYRATGTGYYSATAFTGGLYGANEGTNAGRLDIRALIGTQAKNSDTHSFSITYIIP